ncbi:unnamed protein product [Phaeothamnion confervicola]
MRGRVRRRCLCCAACALAATTHASRGLSVTAPTPIHEDNKPCSYNPTNLFSERRVKHIDIKFHIVRKRVESGEVLLVAIWMKDQIADLFTKPLPTPRTRFRREQILGEYYFCCVWQQAAESESSLYENWGFS